MDWFGLMRRVRSFWLLDASSFRGVGDGGGGGCAFSGSETVGSVWMSIAVVALLLLAVVSVLL